MIDPLSVTLSHDTQIAADVTLEPNIFIGENVSIGMGTIIHAFSHLEGVRIGENVSIGPFARLRPQSKIGDYAAVGNFCEVNRSELKAGAKSKHMSYLGDATIGEKTNIGAGTVIANYDGFDKNQTIISEQVFVGSNSTLIAPLKVDKGAIIAAGSVITEDVDANAMAVARSRQTTLDGWAKDYRDKKKKS
jgi:bifunctional UDP-N-acetylglucosamine pyrophosphorylase/glucosamine-1-phosphate N-acetyltransferase